MISIVKNLTLYQGEDFSNTISTTIMDANNSLVDFTSYAVYGQFAEDSQSSTFYKFVATGAPNAAVVLQMNSATTSQLTPQRYYYDVFGVSAGVHYKLAGGTLTVHPSIDPTFI